MKYYTIIHLKHLFPFSFLSFRHFVITRSKIVFYSVNNNLSSSSYFVYKIFTNSKLYTLYPFLLFISSGYPFVHLNCFDLFSRITIRVQIWMYPDKILQVKALSEKCNGRNATNCSTVIEMREQRKFLNKFTVFG